MATKGSNIFSKLGGPVAALGLALSPLSTGVSNAAPAPISSSPNVERPKEYAAIRTTSVVIHAEHLASRFADHMNDAKPVVMLAGNSNDLGLAVAQFNVEFNSVPKAFALLKGNDASKIGINIASAAAHGTGRVTSWGHQQSVQFNQG